MQKECHHAGRVLGLKKYSLFGRLRSRQSMPLGSHFGSQIRCRDFRVNVAFSFIPRSPLFPQLRSPRPPNSLRILRSMTAGAFAGDRSPAGAVCPARLPDRVSQPAANLRSPLVYDPNEHGSSPARDRHGADWHLHQ